MRVKEDRVPDIEKVIDGSMGDNQDFECYRAWKSYPAQYYTAPATEENPTPTPERLMKICKTLITYDSVTKQFLTTNLYPNDDQGFNYLWSAIDTYDFK